MNDPKSPVGQTQSRRHFLKQSTVLTAGAMAAASAPAVLGQAKPVMNAVVIGCGGRGSGAGQNFLEACQKSGVEGKVVAVADLFPRQARRGTDLFGVPQERCFSGFDCVQCRRWPPDATGATSG